MDKKVLVIQYEQFFGLDDIPDISEVTRDALDNLRNYGEARIVGSYETIDDTSFLEKAVSTITVKSPITIVVD